MNIVLQHFSFLIMRVRSGLSDMEEHKPPNIFLSTQLKFGKKTTVKTKAKKNSNPLVYKVVICELNLSTTKFMYIYTNSIQTLFK